MAITTTGSLEPKTVNGKAPDAVVPEPTVQPKLEQKAETPAETQPDLVEVELYYEFANNYNLEEARKHGLSHLQDTQTGAVKFGPGKVKVPSAIADDLIRRQMAAMQAERDLIRGQDLTRGHLAHLG